MAFKGQTQAIKGRDITCSTFTYDGPFFGRRENQHHVFTWRTCWSISRPFLYCILVWALPLNAWLLNQYAVGKSPVASPHWIITPNMLCLIVDVQVIIVYIFISSLSNVKLFICYSCLILFNFLFIRYNRVREKLLWISLFKIWTINCKNRWVRLRVHGTP